MLEKNINIETS